MEIKSITDNLISRVEKERETIILDRIAKLTGNKIDLIEESGRMFPRLAVRYKVDGDELYYWNNMGTDVLLVTFYSPKFEIENKSGETKVICIVNYK